jgi:hypothetical protein
MATAKYTGKWIVFNYVTLEEYHLAASKKEANAWVKSQTWIGKDDRIAGVVLADCVCVCKLDDFETLMGIGDKSFKVSVTD